MNIYGLNIASSTGNPNGRGGIRPDGTFQYLPIEEHRKLARNAPTYREYCCEYCRKKSSVDVKLKYPDLRVHLDPEFKTFTYGHARRFGDHCLWEMKEGDILFFYATLDLLPKRTTWGLFIVGYFTIDHVKDTRKWSADQIRRLKGFEQNAHLKWVKPGVDLLIKGSKDSRLYEHAIHLSCPRDSHRLHPDFTHQLTTVTGKPLKGKTWHRWLFHSTDSRLAERLRRST
jgi:hypothetical protein